MKLLKIFICLLPALAIAVASCDNGNGGGGMSSSMMPNITGATGEVMVIMQDKYYEGKAGAALDKYLREEVPALPQSEPVFNVSQIQEPEFKKIMQSHRNIVRATIGNDVDTTAYILRKDMWAHPQYVIEIKAPTVADFIDIVELNGEHIQRVFKNAEKNRTIRSYRKYEDSKIPKVLARDHHLTMTVPKGYSIAMNKDNFVWILKEKGNEDFYQSINVYYQDYLDTSDFSESHLLDMREKFMKNIEGQEPGSRMITEPRLPVTYERTMFNELYAAKIRGLWRKTGDVIMGGPFISYSFVDEARNRMITVEGWVYAPDYDKRNYIWQLDAILQSVKLLEVQHKTGDKPS